MRHNPYDRFFWKDWDADLNLKLCSLAAQGLWMRMLCVCAGAERKGYLSIDGQPVSNEDLAALCGRPVEEIIGLLSELENRQVFSRDYRGVVYNRRMLREEKKRISCQKGGKKGGPLTYENKKGIYSSRGIDSDTTRDPTIPLSTHTAPTKPLKPLEVVEELPLDGVGNFYHQGEHLRITNRKLEELQAIYPNLNVRSVIRLVETQYPRRQNKSLSADEYLERTLARMDGESRAIKREEKEAEPDLGLLGRATDGYRKGDLPPLGREPGYGRWKDLRLWWARYGRGYLELGQWDRDFGPKPWEPGTECPEGVFTPTELNIIRRTYDAINQTRTSRNRNNGSGSSGEPQDYVSGLQPLAKEKA